MDLLSSGINAVVVATVGLLLGWFAKGQFEAINRRFEENDRQHLDSEQRLDRFEDRLDARMNGFQRSIDSMHSDLTQVALAGGVRPRAADQ